MKRYAVVTGFAAFVGVLSALALLFGVGAPASAAGCSALAPCPTPLPGLPSCMGLACISGPTTGAFKKYQGPADLRKQVQAFFNKFPNGQAPTVDGIAMPVSDPGEKRLGSEQLYKQLAPSVLYVTDKNSTETGQGSAVAITPHVAMTDCHVVMYGDGSEDDPSTIFTHNMQSITVTDSSNHQAPAIIILEHPDIDICLIEPLGLTLTPVPGLAPFSELEIGEPVYTLGNPEGLALSLGAGLISQLRPNVTLSHGVCANIIQFTAPMSQGSSGGALLDHAGQLIGITQSYIQAGENLNIAIPASLLWDRFATGTTASPCS
jgi:S1-C subfamily serine protease